MALQMELVGGGRYEVNSIYEIDTTAFRPSEVAMLFYGRVSFAFEDGEIGVAHRKRKSMTVGDQKIQETYVLITNMRNIVLWPNGRVVSEPLGETRHADTQDAKLTAEELAFMDKNKPTATLLDLPN